MTTMARAAVFTGVGEPLQFREFPVPAPHDDEVLVRVLACTLCGSDLHTFEGRRTVPVPTILGHEILGRVEALGATARRHDSSGVELRVGDRVTYSLVASCGNCFCCQRSLPQKCERMVKYGHEPLRPNHELTGGLADYCLLASGTSIVRLPDHLSDEIACPANCATATVAAAIQAAGKLRNRSVLVMGAGMLGLTACAMARSAGAAEAICVDVNAERLTQAEAFGATRVTQPDDLGAVVASITERHGVDVAFELSGSPDAFESALPLLRLGGSMVLVGSVFPSRPVPMSLDQVVRRNLRLIGIHNYTPDDLQVAVRFLSEQRHYPFESLVSRWLPLSETERAFQTAREPGVLRVGVRPAIG